MNDKQTAEGLDQAYAKAINRLTKWRSVLVGWIWGSKGEADPGVQGMRDLMVDRIVNRVETNAVIALLIEKGVITIDEFKAQVVIEADEYQTKMEATFEGFRATDQGLAINTAVAQETTKRLGFPG